MPLDPAELRRHFLQDGNHRVTILSLGCITQDWRVVHQGAEVPVVLGYADQKHYIGQTESLGAIVGRVANRISNACFTLENRQFQLAKNIAPHHLHGGPTGVGHKNWTMDTDKDRAVRLTYHSPDGEGGYPGDIDFQVIITLANNRLTYDMTATTDRPTPINLANHNYYNLMGGAAPIWDHDLQLNASATTSLNDDLLPTGKISPINGTSLDFRQMRNLGEADPNQRGSDANLVLDQGDGPFATLKAPNGLTLRMTTDQAGVQLYTSGNLTEKNAPLRGQKHQVFHGICLEAQAFPDAVNRPEFPSIIVTPDQPYRQVTSVEIS